MIKEIAPYEVLGIAGLGILVGGYKGGQHWANHYLPDLKENFRRIQKAADSKDYSAMKALSEERENLFLELDQNTGMWHLLSVEGIEAHQIVSKGRDLEKAVTESK